MTAPEARASPLLRRCDLVLRPDPRRVVLRPFVPAEDEARLVPGIRPRVAHIVEQVLALSPAQLDEEYARMLSSLRHRHRDVERLLRRRYYDLVEPYLGASHPSAEQALLIGAFFAEEYAFEAAALFNPSIVPHPDQRAVPPGSLRFILSLRAVGEGHISSITFRTGLLSADGILTLDPVSREALSPGIETIPGGVPDDPGFRLSFGTRDDLSALVLFPIGFHQRHGIEDLRLLRFTEEDGESVYFGTYTANGGDVVRQELLRTSSFSTFELSALRGGSVPTKGMALFPRRVGGHYAMLGRLDHENISLLRSNDLYQWDGGCVVVRPRWPWEFVQLGNSGPPIELDEGWLVLTHGVGPVRTYCLGACLLDKSDPSRLLARTTEPLVRPGPETRDGYVPNVTYSCGALLSGRTVLLPYGVADSFTAFATLCVDGLVANMT